MYNAQCVKDTDPTVEVAGEENWWFIDRRKNYYSLSTRWIADTRLHLSIRYHTVYDVRLPEWLYVEVRHVSPEIKTEIMSARPRSQHLDFGSWIYLYEEFESRRIWHILYGNPCSGNRNKTWDLFIDFSAPPGVLAIALDSKLRGGSKWKFWRRSKDLARLVQNWDPIHIN